MALRYIGEPNKFYVKVTVGKNYQTTLEPVPGEVYQIDDPGDGNWEPEVDSEPVKADKGPVVADTVKTAENEPTEAVEGN
jgi:hypothetical protein